MQRLHPLVAALFMLMGLLAPVSTVLRADTLTESKVKAAFLYNFTKFVVWPTSLEFCTF